MFTLQVSIINYHPQTKFVKVMFSQLSVCPQGDLYLCPGGSLSRGVCRGVCPGGVSIRGVSVQGGLSGGVCPGGSLSGGSLSRRFPVQGVSVQVGLCLGARSRSWRPACTVMRGQNASYWNVFLFRNKNIA